ncbi:CBS domain-containing protein [Nocardiopsis sediminis]|uniref:CBS domain-containing protein n=1 Tax=Nocardiopsis sediminis TaxID=1778267 RepID=A0ABV8FHV9_9ACTN
MLVAEMMSAPRVELTETMPVGEAAQMLSATGCDGAPVTGADGRLCGIITQIDLLRDRFGPVAGDVITSRHLVPPQERLHVGDVMTDTVVTAEESDDAHELAHRMMETRIRCVPVVRDGVVVGVVRRGDLLRTYLRPDREIRREVLDEIARRSPETGTLDAIVEDGSVTITGTDDTAERRRIGDVAAKVPGVRAVEITGQG